MAISDCFTKLGLRSVLNQYNEINGNADRINLKGSMGFDYKTEIFSFKQ